MSEMPEVSFCIPVYNSAARIERCLRGVLAQNIASREILLVDNASTDDTVAKAKKMLEGAAGARIVVNEKNLGRIENWNRCLELAEGRYIKFALANDMLMPGGTALLLAAARSNPKAAIICSLQENVDGITEPPPAVKSDARVEALPTREALLRFGSDGNNSGGLGGLLADAKIIRRDTLRFRTDIPYWSDFQFAIDLAARGGSVYIHTETYLFDRSVKGRFAVAGTGAQTHSLCLEARECSMLLAKYLRENGADPTQAYEYLYQIYTGKSWFGPMARLSVADTRKLFEGAGEYQSRTLSHARWKSLGKMEHPLQRLLSKVGLYHYPWEK